jgi:hypothetical protein
MSKKVERQGEFILLRGAVEIARHNAFTGEADGHRENHNTVVTAGRRWVLERIYTTSAPANTVISHMGIGTSTASLGTDDTALASEFGTRKTVGTFSTTNLTSNPPSWEAQTSWATKFVIFRYYACKSNI